MTPDEERKLADLIRARLDEIGFPKAKDMLPKHKGKPKLILEKFLAGRLLIVRYNPDGTLNRIHVT